ncbi:MAG: GTP cyclohydrolase II [Candidatus Micrarchaeia archaeon]
MLKKVAEAFLPTKFGNFTVHAFVEDNGKEHLALTRCEHEAHEELPVRIHSRCLTGDTLTSRRCDCHDQLEASMRYIEKKKCGMLIYLDQEGRGIGLANKIKAYALQDSGMDTVQANVHLGFGEDQRDYSAAADMLKSFGIKKVALMTNNPQKIKDIESHGISVTERIPIVTKVNIFNKKYMDTKKKRMNHIL